MSCGVVHTLRKHEQTMMVIDNPRNYNGRIEVGKRREDANERSGRLLDGEVCGEESSPNAGAGDWRA
jgi:hypothetical protein